MMAIGDEISEHPSELKHHSRSKEKDVNAGRIMGPQADK